MTSDEARLLCLEAAAKTAWARLAADEARLAGLENASWLTAGQGRIAPPTACTWTVVVRETAGSTTIAGVTVEALDPAGGLLALGVTNVSGRAALSFSVPGWYYGVPHQIVASGATGYHPASVVFYYPGFTDTITVWFYN